MTSWFIHHGRALRAALARAGAQPFGSLFNVLAVGIALALPLGLYVAVDNLRAGVQRFEDSNAPQLSVFLDMDAGRDDIAALRGRLQSDTRVAQAQFVPRAEALEQLKHAGDMGDVIDSLGRNPLPDAFVVNARNAQPAALEALRDDIAKWPRVDHVQLDAAWAQRLAALLQVGRYGALLIAALLAAALVAVAFNTIRLQILTQRDEIEVARLIGATDAYIRRPFLYFGTLLGVAGAAAAWLIAAGGIALLNRQLDALSAAYATLLRISYPDAATSLALVAIAAALGWLGAALAAGRHVSGSTS